MRVSTDFYNQSALTAARQILGMRLVRVLPDGSRIAGRIVETEAYTGADDLASHGRLKRTKRSAIMWGPPGRAYVYLIYGMHWMLNFVVEPDGQPAAILIRAVEPVEGLEIIQRHRPGRKAPEWTNGPARVAHAFAITGALNGVDLTAAGAKLWLETDETIPERLVRTGPRVGLGKTPEPWLSIPWRWWVGGNRYVSTGSGKSG